ncbi:hypothetical protein ElyMa_005499900, partial [Elysia marginata]
MSEKVSNMDSGDNVDEEGLSVQLETVRSPPPSYESAEEYEDAEAEDNEMSSLELQGQGDNGAARLVNAEGDEVSAEEKKKNHDIKIKKLIADLRRECSVDDVAPEEIEMTVSVGCLDDGVPASVENLNVGDDALTESEMSSVPSSARERTEPPLGASATVAEEDVTETKEDEKDASLKRLSRRLSMLLMTTGDAAADAGNGGSNVEPPQDEVSVENGEDRPK